MSMCGNIFNIQKFSIHDGPGIRTTVFFKGCPLRCRWCANPESQLAKLQIMYDAAKCRHCLRCVDLCKSKALKVNADSRIVCDFSLCIGCLECVNGCPAGALSPEGSKMEVGEIVKLCLQDKDFYEESGGGVTLSGGELLAQAEFAGALCDALKAEGIHCAAETTGHAPAQVFQSIAAKFDLLLYDVKHFDSAAHKAGTGVGNELITDNLRWAVKQGLEVLPRVPVIPGFNDSPEAAAGIAELIKSCGLKRVQLLPFHQLGERKYEFLNRDYALAGLRNLHPEDLEDYRQIYISHGLDCFF